MQQAAEVYAEREKKLYIITLSPTGGSYTNFSRRRFYFDESPVDLHEMAWATSMQCRFTGHVKRRYSVAEHGILVSKLMLEPECYALGGSQIEALMHDAHEGYVSDLSAPAKAKVLDYKPFEAMIEARMRSQFGLPTVHSPGVKFADWLALFIEAEQLLGEGASEGWLEPQPGTRDLALEVQRRSGGLYTLEYLEQTEAYEGFLTAFDRYLPGSI